MGSEQKDKPGDTENKTTKGKSKKEPWWFKQKNPIDRFTGWLVAWTALLFVATIINAIILHKTDQTLRDTLGENRRAADAATKSVDLARQTAERQLRAYVAAELSGLTVGANKTLDGAVTLKNIGQTPAYKIISVGLVTIGEFPPPQGRLPASFGTAPVSARMLGNSIQEKATFLGQGRDVSYSQGSIKLIGASRGDSGLTKDEFANLSTGKFRLYTIGAAYYYDIFGTPRYVRWCQIHEAIVVARRRTVVPTGWTACESHNDAN